MNAASAIIAFRFVFVFVCRIVVLLALRREKSTVNARRVLIETEAVKWN
jgi:hypothetical protein